MNATDKIITALTLGSIFNTKGSIFRSLESLALFSGKTEDEVLSILDADLSQLVTCKPSKKGILVALIANIPPPVEEGPLQVLAMPIGPPGVDTEIVADLDTGLDGVLGIANMVMDEEGNFDDENNE